MISSSAGEGAGSPAVRVVWLSVAAALLTIAVKGLAWALTDSVGLLSDALESFVNLAGALVALRMLALAHAPPDKGHPFGHTKAEYLSSGFEALLILAAAIAIGVAAVGRLITPAPLQALDVGLLLAALASGVNLGVARILHRAAKRHRSIALEADARHLMTDVWTTVGLIIGLILVALTDALWLDPVLALLVAANIAREAFALLKATFAGLLDAALPPEEQQRLDAALTAALPDGVEVASMRSRRAGRASFAVLVLRVPGGWTVEEAHRWVDRVEASLEEAVPGLSVLTHVEPLSGATDKG